MEIFPIVMRLREPFTIAYETIESVTNIFCRVETDKGIHGFGCCCPDEAVTGELPETVIEAWENAVVPTLKGADPIRIAFLMEKLKKKLSGRPPWPLRIWPSTIFWERLRGCLCINFWAVFAQGSKPVSP